jgi:NADPH-dependent curcumin reductase CurA
MRPNNRKWLLARRPSGTVEIADFAYTEEPFVATDLAPGEILVRNRIISCAPTIRNWLNEPGRSYRGSIGPGEPIRGLTGSQVLKSRHPDFAVGDLVTAIVPWQDFAVISPDTAVVPVTRIDPNNDLISAMTLFSANTLTAYFGLTEIGQARPGEIVLVSGAAGSVGSMACQIARNLGCKVVGIAGGEDKCAWLRRELGVEAIDYKHEDVAARLAVLCPQGVNVFLDNVGGSMLQAAIDHMAPFGRIAVSGQISAYDSTAPAPGPQDMMKLVYGRLRMQGFLVGDFADRFAEALRQLWAWSEAGDLIARVDQRFGFEELPAAFVALFHGGNNGTLLVNLASVKDHAHSRHRRVDPTKFNGW